MVPIQAIPGGVSFFIKVHPRARKNALTGIVGDAVKISLSAPPVDGRANRAVIEFLAELFEIPCSSVTISSGATSRVKRVHVAGTTAAAVRQRLQETLAKA